MQELRAAARQVEAERQAPGNRAALEEVAGYQVEFQKKFALAAASIFLTLLEAPAVRMATVAPTLQIRADQSCHLRIRFSQRQRQHQWYVNMCPTSERQLPRIASHLAAGVLRAEGECMNVGALREVEDQRVPCAGAPHARSGQIRHRPSRGTAARASPRESPRIEAGRRGSYPARSDFQG